ncbi:MAG: hypothetical protein J6K46_06580 [Sutterella sp.]|nr:hypothetical protein [Sutterella sp.]
MPVSLQALQSFTAVSDPDSLKFGSDNTLEKRNVFGRLFRRIGDAFLRLSQSGRASIAARQDRICAAMEQAVAEARADAQPDVQELSVRLDAAAKRLREASAAGKSAALTDMLTRLRGYPEFQRLPEVCQKALEDGFTAIANTRPYSSWRSSMDTLGSYFMNFSVDRLNFNPAMVRFGNDLKDEFLKPEQQGEIDANGIHDSFPKDTVRRSIRSIGDFQVPYRDTYRNLPAGAPVAPEDQIPSLCEAQLRVLVGEEHAELLPFISMMATQAGVDSAALNFPYMAGLSEKINQLLLDASLMPQMMRHSTAVVREDNDLLITTSWHAPFTNNGLHGDGATAVLTQDGEVRMRIHLAALPEQHDVTLPATEDKPEEVRQVLIPQFSIDHAVVRYTPGATEWAHG